MHFFSPAPLIVKEEASSVRSLSSRGENILVNSTNEMSFNSKRESIWQRLIKPHQNNQNKRQIINLESQRSTNQLNFMFKTDDKI